MDPKWEDVAKRVCEAYGFAAAPTETLTVQTDPLFDEIMALCGRVFKEKGKDYTIGQDDRLHNFITCAELQGLHPRQVWFTYFYKHFAAIAAWCKTGKLESEGIESRMQDIINYCILGIEISRRFP